MCFSHTLYLWMTKVPGNMWQGEFVKFCHTITQLDCKYDMLFSHTSYWWMTKIPENPYIFQITITSLWKMIF